MSRRLSEPARIYSEHLLSSATVVKRHAREQGSAGSVDEHQPVHVAGWNDRANTVPTLEPVGRAHKCAPPIIGVLLCAIPRAPSWITLGNAFGDNPAFVHVRGVQRRVDAVAVGGTATTHVYRGR